MIISNPDINGAFDGHDNQFESYFCLEENDGANREMKEMSDSDKTERVCFGIRVRV